MNMNIMSMNMNIRSMNMNSKFMHSYEYELYELFDLWAIPLPQSIPPRDHICIFTPASCIHQIFYCNFLQFSVLILSLHYSPQYFLDLFPSFLSIFLSFFLHMNCDHSSIVILNLVYLKRWTRGENLKITVKL